MLRGLQIPAYSQNVVLLKQNHHFWSQTAVLPTPQRSPRLCRRRPIGIPLGSPVAPKVMVFLRKIWSRFFMPLRNLFFPILAPKNLPKWSQNRPKIDEKWVPTALPKKVPKKTNNFDDFPLFPKRSMCTKHCKNKYETMIFVEPSHAQHLIKNIQKQSKHHPKIL